MRLRPACHVGLALLLPLIALAWAAPPAAAHGGQFIPPIPPIGPPPAPKIPGLPPPSTPTLPTSPTAPATPVPLTGPTTPTGPGAVLRNRKARTARAASNTDDAWQTWWNLNRLHYLPGRDDVWRRLTVTPRGGEDDGAHAKRRTATAQAHVVPYLLSLLDAKARTRDDVKASALLALGKVSQDPGVTKVMLLRVTDGREAQIVRESAALACGLLRRSDPAIQFEGTVLDDLREELIRVADEDSVPVRVRTFCVLSLGLLGDQPFGSPYTKDGRLVTRALWQRLDRPWRQRDLPIGILTALGMQSPAGVPDAIREGLRRMVLGKSVQGRRWDSVERGHALTAALRLGGPPAQTLLLRVLRAPREHRDVRRAAYLALGIMADRLDGEQRAEVAKAMDQANKRDRDPLSRGLAHLAQGHLLGADLRAQETRVIGTTSAGRVLLAAARSGAVTTRGYAALGLALACRQVESESREVKAFVSDAHAVLMRGLAKERGDPSIRSAFAVAAGLAHLEDATDTLRALVEDRKENAELRGHAAVALGQIGPSTLELQRALQLALADRRNIELRRQAAFGLAFLGGRQATTQLLRQLETGATERLLAQVVVALGRLGDLAAVHPLQQFAKDPAHAELSRSLAVVALGLLVDPEARPSLHRLTWSGFYPARTESLHEAYTIL